MAITMTQLPGRTPTADNAVNRAIPARDPLMSIAYALSGGIWRSRRESGSASAAMTAVASATMLTSTNTLASTLPLGSDGPMKMSSADPRRTFSWTETTSFTITNNNSGNAGPNGTLTRRPRMIPIPIPRKLAIRRMFVKKPTYATFAGIHRMRKS